MEILAGPPAWFEFDGERWYRNRRGYYQNRTGFLLHRVLYERYRENIDPGILIHHRDGNPANNALDNLEAVTPGEHNRRHPEKFAHLVVDEVARERAHRLWEQRQPRTIRCAECGVEVETIGMRSKFCRDPNCRARYYRRQRRASLAAG